jgi:porphobilinogen synthase
MTIQPFPGRFPDTRLRRTRRHGWLRRAVAETVLSSADLVWPLFVHDHEMALPVASMPGVERLPVEGILRAAGEALRLGIPAIAIFPVVEAARKTDDAAEACNPENLACRTVRAVRKEYGDALGISQPGLEGQQLRDFLGHGGQRGGGEDGEEGAEFHDRGRQFVGIS